MTAAAVGLLSLLLPPLPADAQATPPPQITSFPQPTSSPQPTAPPQSTPSSGKIPSPQQASPPGVTRPVIDDEILRKEYEAYRASLAGMRLYHVRYIRVPMEDTARELIARIRSGARFEDLAREYSTHAETAANGGDLGTHAGCRWGKTTLEVLDSLKRGQTWPRPVKGTHGWGIYRLESVTEVEPRSFEQYRSELLSGRFEPECPWVPPVTVAPGSTGIGRK